MQGALYGWTKTQCDTAFLVDMKSVCASARRRRLPVKRGLCSTTAEDVYYKSVHLFGHLHYHSHSSTESYCSQSWVSSCLP